MISGNVGAYALGFGALLFLMLVAIWTLNQASIGYGWRLHRGWIAHRSREERLSQPHIFEKYYSNRKFGGIRRVIYGSLLTRLPSDWIIIAAPPGFGNYPIESLFMKLQKAQVSDEWKGCAVYCLPGSAAGRMIQTVGGIPPSACRFFLKEGTLFVSNESQKEGSAAVVAMLRDHLILLRTKLENSYLKSMG